MNLHEYQAKQILKESGLKVLEGYVAYTPEEAVEAAKKIGGGIFVVKAQIHAGGRGKGGGVKIAHSLEEVKTIASSMLGMTLVTNQTGPKGRLVKRIYIEQGCEIGQEFYLSALVDRSVAQVVLIASQHGGVDIEEVAQKNPKEILKFHIDIGVGIMPFHGRQLTKELGLSLSHANKIYHALKVIYNTFMKIDASLIEINPLVFTKKEEIVALDAKIVLDDNALFRHKELYALRDEDEEDPTEILASKSELSYIKLDGNIGCLVNGAGLAMSTMDIIKLYGGEPANFLDVGGGATKERVEEAFKIILSDPNVESILVNIFGGIMRCDIIAEGIISAARHVGLNVPLVVRLQGTNMELGRQLLAESDLPIISAQNLDDAARLVVQATKEN